jgi:G6PDH family F420-dependent oxidoreductase
MRIGYFLSGEEFGPKELVEQARLAERAGFHGLWISDHYHPWIDAQGHSPFVWSTIGAIAQATGRMLVTTAVTCPTVRIHPAIIAQAAATSAVLLDGRFALGVGTGEALNEHVLGDPWPTADVRIEMLEEAIEVIRALWSGEMVEHRGRHYTVENARVYTLPAEPPPIIVSAFGPRAVAMAGRVGDGYCATMPDAELLRRFHESGGAGAHAGGHEGLLESRRGRMPRRRPPALAQRGAPGRACPDPPHAGALRAGRLAGQRGHGRRGRPVRAGRRAARRRAARVRRRRFRRALVQQIGGRHEAFFEVFAREVLPRFA